MSLVFEEPPQGEGPGLRFRERSPERKQMDEMLTQLSQYPEQWARLYDFHEADKEDADKMAGKVRSAAGYLQTGHGWSVTVRRTEHGWSVFAKMSNDPPRQRQPAAPRTETPEPRPEPPSEQQREATFQ
jgi:hypothetical protein